jgi:hypothetical protein
MDSNPQTTKPITDDQELAKVLAGINQQTDQAMQFETTPVTTPTVPAPASTLPTPDPVVAPEETPAATEPEEKPAETPAPAAIEDAPADLPTPTVASSDDLSDIKKDALNDLRPLVGKLDLEPDEKFDTYLLLIRSTDDKSLVAPAYAAAQSIPDESRKAQALLDVIKEIDYLSNPPQ